MCTVVCTCICRMSPEGYLTIMNVSRDDEGHYFCAAENTEGYAVDEMWLSVTGMNVSIIASADKTRGSSCYCI